MSQLANGNDCCSQDPDLYLDLLIMEKSCKFMARSAWDLAGSPKYTSHIITAHTNMIELLVWIFGRSG